MNTNLSVMGDKIEIEKGREDQYFPFYIKRYHQGICTLIAGCCTNEEVIAKVSGLVNGTYYLDEDDLK